MTPIILDDCMAVITTIFGYFCKSFIDWGPSDRADRSAHMHSAKVDTTNVVDDRWRVIDFTIVNEDIVFFKLER